MTQPDGRAVIGTRQADERCPATTRHMTTYSAMAIGVQCKFFKGHDGDHAGHGGFSEGDVFWPQEAVASST